MYSRSHSYRRFTPSSSQIAASLYSRSHSRQGPTPTSSQIAAAAKDTMATLRRAGVDACFVGGMACNLFGVNRKPNDLDILCISSGWSEEGLKSKVIELNPRFYRIAARDPSATYTVLWYRIADNGARLKVDLMLPGAMNIPVIPVHTFDTNNLLNLACAPLSLVLLLKLQAWVQHGEADEARYYMKQPTDAQDILELLSVARQKRIQPRSESYFPNLFVSRAESRAEKYVSRYPGTKASWMDLGFVFTGGNNRSTRLSSGSHLVSLDSFDMYY